MSDINNYQHRLRGGQSLNEKSLKAGKQSLQFQFLHATYTVASFPGPAQLSVAGNEATYTVWYSIFHSGNGICYSPHRVFFVITEAEVWNSIWYMLPDILSFHTSRNPSLLNHPQVSFDLPQDILQFLHATYTVWYSIWYMLPSAVFFLHN